MTEYELADYTNSLLDTFLTIFTIYMSIVTAYVIAAFAAGFKLTKFQVVVVNVLFVTSTSVMGLLGVLVFRRFYAHAVITKTPLSNALDTPVDFTFPVSILFVVLVLGALIFMWAIRHPKTE